MTDAERQSLRVMYSCPLCNTTKRAVLVPTREDENVVEWVEQTVIRVIAADHSLRSPLCPATEIKDLMIPISGTEKIGGPPIA